MSAAEESPPFTGFRPAALEFLEGLARHQRREWFDAHREDYQNELREPLAALVSALGPLLRRRRLPLLADPQRALFRIHRDVRFARDKRPYKTHAGAALTRSGEKMDPGMLYIHIDPLGSFVASGFYRPQPDALQRLRRALVADPAGWQRCLATLARHGHTLDPDQDALARLPRGFEAVADRELRTWLRWKSFLVMRRLGDDEVGDPALPGIIDAFVGQTAPLLRFGWAAIDG